ncbi:MAG: hypothetical protein U1E87_06485 [Alphaproteobacteria bacterium]
MSLAFAYEREGAGSLRGFLKYVSAHGQQIKRDMEEAKASVRVMTVHGAKGAQAPVVFLIDTCRATRAPRDAQLAHRRRDADRSPAGRPTGCGCGASRAAGASGAGEGSLREFYGDDARLRPTVHRRGHRARAIGLPAGPFKGDRWHALMEAALAGLPGTEKIGDGEGTILRFRKAPKGPPKSRPPSRRAIRRRRDLLQPPPAEAETLRRTPSGLLPAEEARPPRTRLAPPRKPCCAGASSTGCSKTFPSCRRRNAAAARRLAGSARYRSLEAHTQDILAEVFLILEDPSFGAAFGPESRAEVKLAGSFVAASGRRMIVSGQIGRLVAEAVARADPRLQDEPRSCSGPAGVSRRWRPIVRSCARFCPGRTIEAALLFTSVPSLVPLDPVELDVIAVTALSGAAV